MARPKKYIISLSGSDIKKLQSLIHNTDHLCNQAVIFYTVFCCCKIAFLFEGLQSHMIFIRINIQIVRRLFVFRDMAVWREVSSRQERCFVCLFKNRVLLNVTSPREVSSVLA